MTRPSSHPRSRAVSNCIELAMSSKRQKTVHSFFTKESSSNEQETDSLGLSGQNQDVREEKETSQMDELLGKFLEDQKTKIAEEKACLEQGPPYMEMRRRTGHVLQKEDIPLRTSRQDGVSLPLGEEYERKKHKLQEELRNDYRKYMAGKDHWDTGDIHTVPERRRIPRTVRVRDVATLTEVCGLGWGVCSSEEDCSDEELMLLQGRRHQRERDTRTANRRGELYTETGHHRSKLQHRNRMSTSIATQANERSLSVASQDTVCTTGLLIGAVDLEAALQRKKERYRCELQEQIAEKQSHRRREKELDLRVPTDAEKKQLFVSEASAYRKQPRDDIIRLDTAEPPESVLQYRTDPLSSCRMPFVPTHLPFLTDAYKTPNNDSESLMSPSRAYYPITGVSFSTSSGEPHPLSPHSRSTHRQRIVGENEVVSSGLLVFPAHHAKMDRLSYKEELRKQIEERATQRRVDREDKRRLEAELEADMRAYEPWGRGGAGAPLRDSTGNLITDLKMHLLNAAAAAPPQRLERPGFVETHTPQIARGNVFNQMLSPQQLLEQDQYKAYLRLQIEDKQRKQAEEREWMRAEEEREDRRLAEQREKIRREYEEEQESRKRREMEQKLKNEELARLVEERRRDAEKKKEEEKERAAVREQEEQERQIRLQQVQRAPSPPIPTLQKKHRNPSKATDFSAFRALLSPENGNNQRTEKYRSEVVNELYALRRCLRSEQRHLEEQLLQTEWDHLPSPLTDRHRTDVFDMAHLRMPVRGPSARGTEPISSKRADDIMYRDAFMPGTRQSRNRDVEGGRGSVLLSESEFIDQNGLAFPVPPDSERKSAMLSARERRRLANLRSAEGKPVQLQSFNMRKLRDTNTPRMKRLQAFSHHNTTAGVCSDDDDEASRGDEHFTLQSPGRPSSIDTATTEPWIRAETSDTLRRLMSGSEL